MFRFLRSNGERREPDLYLRSRQVSLLACYAALCRADCAHCHINLPSTSLFPLLDLYFVYVTDSWSSVGKQSTGKLYVELDSKVGSRSRQSLVHIHPQAGAPIALISIGRYADISCLFGAKRFRHRAGTVDNVRVVLVTARRQVIHSAHTMEHSHCQLPR